MEKKTVTFLMVSDRKGITRRFVVSSAWLKALGFFAAVTLIMSSALVVDYVGLLVQSAENKRLNAENKQLHSRFEVVDGKLKTLEDSLERVNSFATKLRMITDTQDSDRSLKLAVGPVGQSVQTMHAMDESLEQREPASELHKEDALFFKKAPLDVASGELAVQAPNDYAALSVRIDQGLKDSELREQGILELWQALSERQSLLRSTPSILPARGWYTSNFGYRISPYTGRPVLHQGLDIAAAPGTPVYAPADGVISYAGYDPGYGKLVSIDHGYGVITRYGHNSRIFVNAGQKVRRGDVVSAVGSTGRATGPHLHYEVRVNSVPVDPLNYILTD